MVDLKQTSSANPASFKYVSSGNSSSHPAEGFRPKGPDCGGQALHFLHFLQVKSN
jgi:hypothetical protein